MRARQAFRRLLTRTKYSLAKPLDRTSIRGKDWSFLENFDDLADLAKFDFQIEFLYRSGSKNTKLIRAGHYDRKSYAAFRKFDGLFSNKYRILICIPWLRVGGAERVAANLAAALRHLYGPGSVAVLVLDFTADQIRKHYRNEPTADLWFPPDVPVFDMTETLSLDRDQRLAALAKLLLGIAPQFIVNVNSKTMWDCFLEYGRQLASQINLVGCLFCNDRDLNDAPLGYAASYFRETLTNLSFVITDQTAFICELTTRFNLIPSEYSKLKCLYQPVAAPKSMSDSARFERLRRPNSYRRQVLWTGRLTRQKNPELLLQIASPQPRLRLPRFRRRPASKWAPARELALSWPFRTLRRYRNRGIRRISLYQPLGRFAERVAGSGRASPPDYRASDGGHRRNCKRSYRLAGAGDQQCRRFQCNPQTSLFRIRTTTRARPYRSDVRIDWDTPLFRDILSDAGNDIWQQGF